VIDTEQRTNTYTYIIYFCSYHTDFLLLIFFFVEGTDAIKQDLDHGNEE